MTKTRIASVWHHRRSDDEVRVYTGRACRGYKESPLGKPREFTPDKGPVLEQYRTWLREKVKDPRSPQTKELLRIAALVAGGKKVTLLCWCAKDANGLTSEDLPFICHAQIVGEVVERVARRIKGEVEPPER